MMQDLQKETEVVKVGKARPFISIVSWWPASQRREALCGGGSLSACMLSSVFPVFVLVSLLITSKEVSPHSLCGDQFLQTLLPNLPLSLLLCTQDPSPISITSLSSRSIRSQWPTVRGPLLSCLSFLVLSLAFSYALKIIIADSQTEKTNLQFPKGKMVGSKLGV